MIRFIDLRGQIDEVEDTPVHFAFFDTVSDRFVEMNATQEWSSRALFVGDYRAEYPDGNPQSRSIERFLGLMPEWVK